MIKRKFVVLALVALAACWAVNGNCNPVSYRLVSVSPIQATKYYIENGIYNGDSMKVKDIVILVKYGQGLVLFNSFFDYVGHMRPDTRHDFLSKTVELIKRLQLQDEDIVTLSKEQFYANSSQFLSLRDGITDEKLDELLNFSDEDLEPTFKLLLDLFAEGYKRIYPKYKNNASKFWYWNYSLTATTFELLELDVDQEIDISNIFLD